MTLDSGEECKSPELTAPVSSLLGCPRILYFAPVQRDTQTLGAISSVARALPSHGRCHRFKSCIAHHPKAQGCLAGSLTTTRHSSAPGQPISKRRPNAYRLKPLISPDEREALWEGLRQKHGAQQFQTARDLAGTIRKSNHYETIEALLRHIDSHGLPTVQAATAKVAALHPTNPMRHVRYIITIVKNAQTATP